MPAWNPNPEWLRQAVASALGQVGCEIELVVVDDGSDVPVERLLGTVTDPRLRLLRIPHGRVSRARNAGIEVARGDYFRFIDCDDVILPGSTAHLLALADGEERVVSYGATLACDDELRPLALISSTIQGDATVACLLNRFSTTIHSLLFPRRIVDAIGEWEPSIVVSQDWDYALRAFELAPVRGDQHVVTHYRMHAGMNSRDVDQGIRGYELVVERYFARNPELLGGPLHRRARAMFHLFAAAQLATRRRRYRAATGHVVKAVRFDLVAVLKALPRHGAMPLTPTVRRMRRRVARQRRHPS